MRKFGLILFVVGMAGACGGVALAWIARGGQSDLKASFEQSGNLRGPEERSRLWFPSLNQDFIVLNGTSEHDLVLGPVHVSGSAMPGQDGNCIIAAHRDTHFRILKNLTYGDSVAIERGGVTYRYLIVDIEIVPSEDTSPYDATNEPVLTLVTCYPFMFVGAAPKRYIVRAKLIGATVPG
jgi:sortase A